jgi:hypothetical protein
MVLILVVFMFTGWGVDALGFALALIAFAASLSLILYLLRITPRNRGALHGGGFEGANAAFGILPFEPRECMATIPPGDDDVDDMQQYANGTGGTP